MSLATVGADSALNPHFRAAYADWAACDRHADRIAANAGAIWQQTRDAHADAWERAGLEGEARSASPGLVSVPTSGAPGVSAAICRAAASDLRDGLEAVKLDPGARRLAKLRMNIGAAARLHSAIPNGRRPGRCVMVTLTYAGTNEDWSPRHISDALKACREWLKRRGHAMRYCWVAELQKRGVIHYHVAVWVPPGVKLPKWDRAGWWPHGMTNLIVAKRAPAYLCKYMSKGLGDSLGSFPKGARVYGVGGLTAQAAACRRWLNWPKFVQQNCAAGDRPKRETLTVRTPAPGGCQESHRVGGWRMPNGSWLPSEWRRAFVGDGMAVVRIHRHPVAVAADGPFSWIQ